MSEAETAKPAARVNLFAAADVEAILRERGWLAEPHVSLAGGDARSGEPGPELQAPPSSLAAWLADAAALLGPHCVAQAELEALLALIFEYDARAILSQPETHVVVTREGARAVVRELALAMLDGGAVDSDRFKEIVTALKEKLPYRGRELFYPLRLVLAGCAGEGELDRVALLLDRAAELFAGKVKACRERVLEFCSVMQ